MQSWSQFIDHHFNMNNLKYLESVSVLELFIG